MLHKKNHSKQSLFFLLFFFLVTAMALPLIVLLPNRGQPFVGEIGVLTSTNKQ